MITRILFCVVFIVISLSATAQVAWNDKVNVTVLTHADSKLPNEPVEVLTSEPAGRPHESLCMITATGGQTIRGSKTGMEMLDQVKAKALECGADAVVIRAVSDQTVKPLRGGIDQGSRLDVVAIRYTGDQ